MKLTLRVPLIHKLFVITGSPPTTTTHTPLTPPPLSCPGLRRKYYYSERHGLRAAGNKINPNWNSFIKLCLLWRGPLLAGFNRGLLSGRLYIGAAVKSLSANVSWGSLSWRWDGRSDEDSPCAARCVVGDLCRAPEYTGSLALQCGVQTRDNGESFMSVYDVKYLQCAFYAQFGRCALRGIFSYRIHANIYICECVDCDHENGDICIPTVCYWAVPMPSCSLIRTRNRSGPTWSGRTRVRPRAPRPPPPCARRSPAPAPCRPPGRTCAPAAVRRSWTDICWRWEAERNLQLKRGRKPHDVWCRFFFYIGTNRQLTCCGAGASGARVWRGLLRLCADEWTESSTKGFLTCWIMRINKSFGTNKTTNSP